MIDGKKKLVYIIHELKPGGVECAVLSAIKTLNEKFDLKIICLGSIDQDFIAGLSAAEKKCLNEYKHGIISILKSVVSVVKFRPDYLLTSLWRSSLTGIVATLFLNKTVYVACIHSSKFQHVIERFFNTLAVRKANFVFADSNIVKEFVGRFTSSDKIRVISFLTKRDQIEFRTPNFRPDHVFRFVFIGRIAKVKRIDRAIEIIEWLVKRGVAVHFDIYGPDDGEKKRLKQIIKERRLDSNVSFFEAVSPNTVGTVFRSYNYLLHMSDREGFAMSVAEAMQNGLICFVTAVGEIPRYSADMKSAVLFESPLCDDPERCADKILRVLKDEDLCLSISRNAQKVFLSKMTYAESLSEEINNIRV
ncbi:MAG: glycosyltransferase family 4 protein [Alphaproteobacteria bacterium]|uniref:Glycosyltransferase family 4 protein n=1 Tax=Candidatus Nitrobium versatile TaxID=2884831 RepID=A0A953SDK2_9BACT|nr:glycosyltransferase family 4 protein [Candidatus Nitrobium versatile]